MGWKVPKFLSNLVFWKDENMFVHVTQMISVHMREWIGLSGFDPSGCGILIS